MIKSIIIKDGLLKELHKENTKFEFTDNVNIIWGKNGTGKSVLVDTLAHYTNVGSDGGWTKDKQYSFNNSEYESYSDFLDKKTEHGIIEIDWDGVPVYHLPVHLLLDQGSMIAKSQVSDNPLQSYRESIENKFDKCSSGEFIIKQINKLIDLKVPDIYDKVKNNKNKSDIDKLFLELLDSKSKDGKPTIILDEIDKSLDIKGQLLVHDCVLPKLSETFQVICISHSVFALREDSNINLIDLNNNVNLIKDYLSTLKFKKEII